MVEKLVTSRHNFFRLECSRHCWCTTVGEAEETHAKREIRRNNPQDSCPTPIIHPLLQSHSRTTSCIGQYHVNITL